MAQRGRKMKYTDVELFQKKVDDYFNMCDEKEKPYTMSGLAYHLDLDRKSLLNYSKNEKFFPTIKKAKQKVEMMLEEQLYRLGNNSGVIFNLKNNFGWIDKVDYDNNDELNKLDKILEEQKNAYMDN